MSRSDMGGAGTDHSGIPRENEVTDGMADEDREEDVSVVVHSK